MSDRRNPGSRLSLRRCVAALTLGIALAVPALACGNHASATRTKARSAVLATGKLGNGSWSITVTRPSARGKTICMSINFKPRSDNGQGQCGFSPEPIGGTFVGTFEDTENAVGKRFVFGPVPAAAARVLIHSWCNEQGPPVHRIRIARRIAPRPLPAWAPRHGSWFVYQTAPGTCNIKPVYLNKFGRPVSFGRF